MTERHPATNGTLLKAESLDVGYGERLVVEQLSVDILKGGVTALVGPNGSGKSTLLKTLARLLKPKGGGVYLDGKSITRMRTAEVAREIAILPQGPVAPSGLTVGELVEQGRFPHAGALRMLRQQDYKYIEEALTLTDMMEFAHRALETLSGGERQRAWIALALAQATPVLLLDEPTTFLDIGHQLEVLELVKRLNVEKGMTIILVLHDLNQAARYATHLVVMKDGRIVASGMPGDILTADLVESVFGLPCVIIPDPVTGTPMVVPRAAPHP